MISKYMLKEVLFYKEKYKDQAEITQLVLNKNYIEYTSDVAGNPYNYITHDKINVYELTNICKEWAKNKGYNILSGYDGSDTPEALVDHTYSEGGCYCTESFKAETEPEAIFKACQWILDNANK